MKLNRRSFIKSAGAFLAALGLGIKAKTRSVATGVGRGSPRVLDSFGGIIVPPKIALPLLARLFGERLADRLGFGKVRVQLDAYFDKNAAIVEWMPGDENADGQKLIVESCISHTILKDARASSPMLDFFAESFSEERLLALN